MRSLSRTSASARAPTVKACCLWLPGGAISPPAVIHWAMSFPARTIALPVQRFDQLASRRQPRRAENRAAFAVKPRQPRSPGVRPGTAQTRGAQIPVRAPGTNASPRRTGPPARRRCQPRRISVAAVRVAAPATPAVPPAARRVPGSLPETPMRRHPAATRRNAARQKDSKSASSRQNGAASASTVSPRVSYRPRPSGHRQRPRPRRARVADAQRRPLRVGCTPAPNSR